MVEIIRELCKKQGTSLTKLEQQLGFGNGVIGRWDRSKPSYDRLEKVANALGVPVSELTGEQQKKPAPNGDGRKELTHENYKISYREMPTTELYAMLSDITNELRERSEKEGN